MRIREEGVRHLFRHDTSEWAVHPTTGMAVSFSQDADSYGIVVGILGPMTVMVAWTKEPNDVSRMIATAASEINDDIDAEILASVLAMNTDEVKQ